uniref:Uncharacterized protein n=1 Tax=Arundo donax TaxID=35708 RepID=A0A0A9AGT1_ARUDO
MATGTEYNNDGDMAMVKGFPTGFSVAICYAATDECPWRQEKQKEK